MRQTPYSFDGREWSSSGARNALRSAAAAMKETGVPRMLDAARLVFARWQSVAARPSVADQFMEDGRDARRLLRLRQKAADARDRSSRAAAAAANVQPVSPMTEEWTLMSRESFHAAESYAARAASLAFALRGERS